MEDKIHLKIKELREKKGLSQTEFAEKYGISPSAISQFESGGRLPSAPMLKKLANSLDTTTDYLLGLDTPRSEDSNAQAFFRNLQELDEDDKQLILKNIEWLKDKKNRRQ